MKISKQSEYTVILNNAEVTQLMSVLSYYVMIRTEPPAAAGSELDIAISLHNELQIKQKGP